MEQRLLAVCKRDVIRIGDIIDSQSLKCCDDSQTPMFRDGPKAGMLEGLGGYQSLLLRSFNDIKYLATIVESRKKISVLYSTHIDTVR